MRKILFAIILILVLIFLYARYIAINGFEVNKFTIDTSMPESFDGLTILHFSDLLINTNFNMDNLEKIQTEINLLEPDIVFFTGDLIDDNYEISVKDKDVVINFLKGINANLYKYSIYGDNDLKNIDNYKFIMDEGDFILLDNKTQLLFYKDITPISITGLTTTTDITNSYAIEEDIKPAMNITLIHEPDLIDNINNNTSIYFAGHSLGGLIKPYLMSPIFTKENAKKYTFGNYENIYVSNGLGVESLPIRFNNTPSVSLYLLKVK